MNKKDPEQSAITHEALLGDGWQSSNTPGFIELVGPILYREEGEAVRLGFIAEPKHRNLRDVVQGGMLATFADRSLAFAARRANNNLPQATIELGIRYIDAVRIGEFVEVVPEIVRKTRSLIFMRGTIRVGERVVATADGIWKILGRS